MNNVNLPSHPTPTAAISLKKKRKKDNKGGEECWEWKKEYVSIYKSSYI